MTCLPLILLKNSNKDIKKKVTGMMKYLKTIRLFSVLTLMIAGNLNLIAQNDSVKDVTGIWLTPKKDSKVKMFIKDGKLYGKFIWFEEPKDEDGNPITDTNNPDTNMRKKPLLNKVFIRDFVPAKKENKWKGGKIYNPRDGRTYKGEISLPSNDTLIVRGFIGISLLGRNSVWTRVPE